MYKKYIFILIILLILSYFLGFFNDSRKVDPVLEKTRKLMEKYNKDLFHMCKGINNSKYFYSTNDFPKLKLLEENADVVRKELENVIKDFESPGILFPIEDLQENWKNFWLMSGDSWHPENIKKCPNTFNILNKIGVKREVLFALLKPGSKIDPHKGTGNYVIRCQLPLLNIPNNSSSGIQCGPGPHQGQKKFHMKDKLIIFDDSNWHSAWNRSNLNRIVLIFDVINPSITEEKYQSCVNEHSLKMENAMNQINKHLPESAKEMIYNGKKNI